jgi:CRISPR-associated protein Csx16
MSIYVVSRHLGAIEFFKDSFPDCHAIFLTHINDVDINNISEYDVVYGVLPVQIIYQLTKKNVKYFHLDFYVTESLRGKEIDLYQLKTMGAQWVEYTVYKKENNYE